FDSWWSEYGVTGRLALHEDPPPLLFAKRVGKSICDPLHPCGVPWHLWMQSKDSRPHACDPDNVVDVGHAGVLLFARCNQRVPSGQTSSTRQELGFNRQFQETISKPNNSHLVASDMLVGDL